MAKITIITTSYRIDNWNKIKNSINFEYTDGWIIVYDGNRIEKNPYIFKENKKTKEYIYIYIYIYMMVYLVMDKEIMH